MRVLLCVNMEGVSQITSYRELWAPFPEYWDTGKAATTADTVAAIHGLKAGGASEITVCELHGPSAGAIVDVDALPEPATWIESREAFQYAVTGANYDALFLLGWQARCGTPNGFMSRTGGINLRVAVDSVPVSDVHINAWRAGIPVIGISGDAALGPQLDGELEGVPFLPVKEATNRAEAQPLYTPEDGAAAIQAFAAWCAGNPGEGKCLTVPERFVLSLSMSPAVTDLVDGEHGLRRTSPAIVAKSVTDWWLEAEPAIDAAIRASFRPLEKAGEDVARLQSILTSWAMATEAEWLT